MRLLHIKDANLTLRCPPGCENCHDIIVRDEIIDGVRYRSMELEFTPEERQAVAEGATLIVRQMGNAWVPVANFLLDAKGEVVEHAE
ncbi:hypothetical protein vBCbaSRXM_75 [Citromicrobium phage vB_CbaS-RXM]|nr:hypothetical protein vBCbaSRXM_75 [Citromicrobium phage vB_CbaS-RXM]